MERFQEEMLGSAFPISKGELCFCFSWLIEMQSRLLEMQKPFFPFFGSSPILAQAKNCRHEWQYKWLLLSTYCVSDAVIHSRVE